MPAKILSCFIAIVVMLQTTAQKIVVKNLSVYNSNSKTVYIGVENKLLVIGKFQQIKSTSDTKAFHLVNDTLIITPYRQEDLVFSFITKSNTQQVVLIARRLPAPIITFGTKNNAFISKTNFLQHNKILLTANDNFFEHFKVDSSVINLNGQTFTCIGDKLNNEVLKAIGTANPGDKLDIAYVHALEKKSGRTFNSNSKVSFVIK